MIKGFDFLPTQQHEVDRGFKSSARREKPQNEMNHFFSQSYRSSQHEFLATLVALHFTPVSEWVSKWAEFRTSVVSRLASLFVLGTFRGGTPYMWLYSLKNLAT